MIGSRQPPRLLGRFELIRSIIQEKHTDRRPPFREVTHYYDVPINFLRNTLGQAFSLPEFFRQKMGRIALIYTRPEIGQFESEVRYTGSPYSA
jgi:hypothetical protein